MPKLLPLILIILLAACTPEPTTTAQIAPASDELLEFGGGIAGVLDNAIPQRQYLFVATADDAIRISLEGDAPVIMTLLTPAGTTHAQGQNSIETRLPLDGVYMLTVSRLLPDSDVPLYFSLSLNHVGQPTASASPHPATSTLTATPLPTLSPTATSVYSGLGSVLGRLVLGQELLGQFREVSDAYVYLVEVPSAGYLRFRLTPLMPGIDPAVTLFDPQGIAVATDEESGGLDTPELLVNLAVSGLYAVQVRADAAPGDYRVRIDFTETRVLTEVTRFAPPPPLLLLPVATPLLRDGELLDHAPLLGSLNRQGDFARYSVRVEAGDMVTIGVVPTDGVGLLPVIDLIDPDGLSVYQASPALVNGQVTTLVPGIGGLVEGEYTVFVTGAEGTLGGFIIGYGREGSFTESFRGELTGNVETVGQMTQPGARDLWSLYLNENDLITLAASSSDAAFTPLLHLIAPDGTALSAGQISIGSVRAPVSGVYVVRVQAQNVGSIGGYSLLWRYLVPAPTPTRLPSRVPLLVVDASLMAGNQAAYTFRGIAGQRLLIEVMALDGRFDPVAELLAFDGTIIAQGDDADGGLDPRFEAMVPADGTYTLRVRAYGDGEGAFVARVDELLAE
jgi:hypothetical protein